MEPLDEPFALNEDEVLINGAARARDGTFTEAQDRRFWDELTRSEAFRRYLARLEHAYRIGKRPYTMTIPLALQAARGFRRNAEHLEYFAVAWARSNKWSWASIGAALGISRSAAQRRYAAWGPKRPKRRPEATERDRAATGPGAPAVTDPPLP